MDIITIIIITIIIITLITMIIPGAVPGPQPLCRLPRSPDRRGLLRVRPLRGRHHLPAHGLRQVRTQYLQTISVTISVICNKSVTLTCARYRHSKDRAQRMVVIPRYEPVFVEPNMKQYEVQVSY